MIGSGDRSQRIRTYNFPQNRLTDHRINLTLYNLDRIILGDLDEVVSALAEYDSQEKVRMLLEGDLASQGRVTPCFRASRPRVWQSEPPSGINASSGARCAPKPFCHRGSHRGSPMRRVLLAALCVSISLVLAAGCGKSGTGPAKPPVESTAPVESGGQAGTEPGVSKYLVGANPPPVVDSVITDGGTLITRFGAEPDTLNPLTGRDYYSGAILGLIMDGLVARNLDTLEWEPRLAESWESSEDHLSYTFHLRKHARWHDGFPVTSADAVYSFERIMDPKVDAPQLRNYYMDLESVTALDDYTVVFTWKKPYFLSFNFSAGLPILPKHVFDNGTDFNTNPAGRAPVGNGPYKFVEWKTSEQIVLVRNEDYYGRKPHITRRIVRFIPDQNAAMLQASSGEVDDMEVSSEDWVKQLPKSAFQDSFNRYYYYDPNYRFIGWNNERPWFADRRVRRAMTELVDREGILDKILYGMARIVTGTFYINSPDYSPEIKPWPYDPADAARLLDEAGWTDHDGDGIRDKVVGGASVPFSFTLTYASGNPTTEQIAVLLQQSLKKVGVDMNVRPLEWALFGEKLNSHDFDAVTLGWSLGLEQDPYQLWHSSQTERGSNFISYSNPEIDDIIEKARLEFDEAKRQALYHRFNEIIHEDQPYTFLFCSPTREIVNKRFHNVIVHKLGLDSRDWYVPANLQR